MLNNFGCCSPILMTAATKQPLVLPGVAVRLDQHAFLIQGPSNIGKSELALQLVQEGGALIADDAVELTRDTKGTIRLSCPDKLQNLIEIRNFGILNIKELYGDASICKSAPLSMVVQLEKAASAPLDRLSGNYGKHSLLSIEVPSLTIGSAEQRPLASLLKLLSRSLLSFPLK